MSRKNSTPLLGQLFKKIAPKIGAKVVMEPVWKVVGQITFKSGKRCYFRYNSLDLNTLGASEISKDKDYANFFMKRLGYPTTPGEAFYSSEWAGAIGSKKNPTAALRFAKKIGFPIIVKPNSGTQGNDVSLARNPGEFSRALSAVFKHDRVALVQRPLKGSDFRIVVLDTQVISAYERTPLSVVGDGRSTILTLLKRKQKEFVRDERDTRLKFNDPRMREKLRSQQYTWNSIPKAGTRVFLLDNANLSSGGDSRDVTKVMHQGFKKMAVALTKDMGLRLCGVDVMVEGSIEKSPKKYYILEINSAPGLDHYARSGSEQKKIVENLYLKVLKGMEK